MKKPSKKVPARKNDPPIDLGIADRLATATLKTYFKGGKHLLRTNGQFLCRSTGFWQRIDEDWLKGRILKAARQLPAAGASISPTIISEALDIIRIQQARRNDPFAKSDDTKHILNCPNGELWFEDDGKLDFRAHDPASYLTYRVSVAYKPQAKCPVYDKTLARIFSKSSDPEGMVRHWHELTGYMLQTGRDHAIVVVPFGFGRNGKTLLVKILLRALGEELAYAAPVGDLKSDRWAMGHFVGKRVYLDDDVARDTVLPDGLLKMLSEPKMFTAERKYHNKFDSNATSSLF
jgi:putative DNA primase/helicase